MNSQELTPTLPAHSDGVNLCLAELLQYKNQSVRWLPPAQSVWSQLNGQHQSRHKGRGMNFAEVRPYQAGDDIRAIDWRVTARTGKTHTKLFTEEREQPVMLLIDISPSMKFGTQLLLKSVQAAHFSSLLSWLAVSVQDRIGAIVFNGNRLYECKPTARQQGPLTVINAMIDAHKDCGDDSVNEKRLSFSDALKHLHHLCPKGSEIVVLSDFYQLQQSDKRRLSQLRQHNRVQFVQLFDPLEFGHTTFNGIEFVTDDQQATWLDFSAQNTRDSLNQQYQEHQDFIQELCKSLAIPLHHLSAAQTLMEQLGHSGFKGNKGGTHG
ncbi:DUF58 domain-containing protein [Photobacterium sp. DNB23_23_1]|uniref:DUF58 domain-containing protein n=1 Tax=Photobacterium pectinilyticum TaxID=2906793 RepID=A0ABT1N3C0_9GAMM|nr:DUF58 domain-containing protein [Photobacterium sp. ZSDE20]MCQ1059248.1 DUF58 domain-containing protein [Photobacterium sp. ZSDE20]MDD1824519.1 DUF58 domain-containing protein [Photobacterium sp. ZSDE20]